MPHYLRGQTSETPKKICGPAILWSHLDRVTHSRKGKSFGVNCTPSERGGAQIPNLYLPVNLFKPYDACLFVCLVFNGTSSTNRLYHAIEVGNISHRAGENTYIMQLNNERIQ